MDIFTDWASDGQPIRWRSTTPANAGAEVTVMAHRRGTPGAPALVLVHGFPTSSIDFFGLTRELESQFDIYSLDFPGYGLSDKPPAPYVYSLYDDARLLVHAIAAVWDLDSYTMLTHDRGDSIGLIALGAFCASFGGVSGYTVAISYGGAHVATVFGTMNMCGNFGAALFPITAAWLVSATGNWNLMLFLFAGIMAVDAVCWALLNPKGTFSGDDDASDPNA